jgi:hypothetical protein
MPAFGDVKTTAKTKAPSSLDELIKSVGVRAKKGDKGGLN